MRVADFSTPEECLDTFKKKSSDTDVKILVNI